MAATKIRSLIDLDQSPLPPSPPAAAAAAAAVDDDDDMQAEIGHVNI